MSEMKRLPGFLLLRWKTADRNHLADVNYDCLYLFFFFAFLLEVFLLKTPNHLRIHELM